MIVTGYKLQQALRELHHRRDIATKQFSDGLYQFKGDDKPVPRDAFRLFKDAERKIARLQVAQMRYNLEVTVELQGAVVTLAEAVKLVGSAGRGEKMWRSTALGDKRSRYGYGDSERSRSTDKEYAIRMVTTGEATEMAIAEGKYASALRTAIQTGNTTEINIRGLTPADFE